MKIRSINPATEKTNKSFAPFSTEKVIKIFENSRTAFGTWSAMDVKKRAAYLIKLAKVLRKRKKEYAKLITLEMGKPLAQSLSEVEKCAWTAEIYANDGPVWLEDDIEKTGDKKSFVTFEPLGVILAIMPWNFPFWQAMRCAIPALAAGNTTVLRHSNVVPMCSLAIEGAFTEAGFPKNVFRSILTDHSVIETILKSHLIDGVSVTGSVEVGKHVAEIAGANMKKFVLELGGSDPFIVLEDADIDFACKKAKESRNISNGQSCIAAKRFIIVKSVAKEFTSKFVRYMKAIKTGDPFDESNENGPLANKEQLLKLQAQVEDAVGKGARVECGGKRIGNKGFFFEPTVLTNVNKKMRVLREEVFGPVASIIIAEDEEDAIRIANDSRFGLGASIWTKDLKKGERIARRIEAGTVHVNNTVHSDPRLPFGGIKDSGIGRELYRYGLSEFTNIKTVVIE